MTFEKWFIYTVIGIVVITAYWLWPIYLLIAMFAVFGNNPGSGSRVRPYKFKKRKMPVYRPVRYKRTKPYRFPKTRRKWGKPVKIDKVWKL